MAKHHYLCPECGVALQSVQDVAGKAVRCLGCQAVFTAKQGPTVSRTAPPPPPPAPQRATVNAMRQAASRQVAGREDDPYEPALPPIPRDRKVPAALFVVGGAMALAIGLTIFLVVRYREKKPEPDATVAVKSDTRPVNAAMVEKKAPVELTPVADLPRRRIEEEEEVAAIPAKDVPAKKGPPDLSSILPKLPGFGPNDLPAGATPPKDPPKAAGEGPSKDPTPPKPAETKPDPTEPPARGDGPIPPALLAKLKAATVFIKVSAGAIHGSGSGFVLSVEGNTALIVTNNHVAAPDEKKFGPVHDPQYELVFHSGRKSEFAMKADLVAGDKDRDLAILRVNGVLGQPEFPAALNTTDKAPLAETMPIYIFGFPFGEMLATSKANPAVTIGKGTISSLREDDAGDAAFIQIDGDVNPGNSGGPVVDARGRLVGVTVAKLIGTNIGMAIPPVELTRMLGGRLGHLDFQIVRSVGTNVEVEVHGALVDPMDRLTAASLLVVRADDLKDKPAVGAGGKWSPLPGAEKVEMKMTGRGVSGVVKLPIHQRDRGVIEILFQPACVDRDGKTTYFAPLSTTLHEGGPATGSPFGPPGTGGPPGGFPGPGGPGVPPPGSSAGPPGGLPLTPMSPRIPRGDSGSGPPGGIPTPPRIGGGGGGFGPRPPGPPGGSAPPGPGGGTVPRPPGG